MSQPSKSRSGRSHLIDIVVAFLFCYTILIIFSIPIVLMLLYRSVIRLTLGLLYPGRYSLVRPLDAFYDMDSFGNVLTSTVFIYLKHPCDIRQIRHRVSKNLFKLDASGQRPFKNLLSAVVLQFGYACFEDVTTTIDLSHHVRYYPETESPNRVFSEEEMFDSVCKLSNDLWPEGKPRWEILIFPKVVRKDEESEQVCTGLVLRVHHVHCDGISIIQFLRNCVFDKPRPKLYFDPVNTSLPPVPLWDKIVFYWKVLVLGPHTISKMTRVSPDPVFYEGPLSGNKLIGRTKMTISPEMIRRIRAVHRTTINSVLHSAFAGALARMARKKGCQVPEATVGGTTLATLPYPDEYPRNNISLTFEPMKIGIADPARRLSAMTVKMAEITGRKYALSASSILLTIIGIFPKIISTRLFGTLHCTYLVSNVPGFADLVRFEGNECIGIFGVPPNCNGIGYSIAMVSYGEQMCVGFSTEKSKLVSNRADMDSMIDGFENEIRAMDLKTNLD